MPLGAGQNIGTAFVRVVVDGKDFDLSDLFDETEGEMGKAGKRGSKAYQEAWRKEWESGPNKTAFDDAIRRMLVSGDTAKAMVNSTEFQRFRANLEKEFGDIGRRAGENLTEEMNQGLDVSELEGRISNMRRDLARAEQQLNADANRERENQYRLHLDTLAAYTERDARNQQQVAMVAAAIREDEYRDLQRTIMLERAYRENKEFDLRKQVAMQKELAFLTRAFRENEEYDIKKLETANNLLRASYKRIRTEVDLMQDGQNRHSVSRKDLIKDLRVTSKALEDAGLMTRQMAVDIDRHHRALLTMNPQLNVWRRSINDVATGLGRAFGRGSRNDFINFVGGVVGGLARIPALFLALGGYVNGFKNRVMDAGSFLGGLNVIAREAAKGLGVFAVGIGGLFGVIGPLISILSSLGGMVLAVVSSMGGALLGGVSALGSTLAFGLGGGAAIAAAAFTPLIAGIGVFALAVKNADRETKTAIKSITREFAGLGEVAAESTFANIDEQARRFRGVIGDLAPLVRGIGTALSRVGDGWLDLMEGPGFAKFQQAMTDFLPDAVEDLGLIIGNLAGGLGGLFRAAIPQAEVFNGWLVRITERFNNFANSGQGQNTLRNFFADAAASAAELGGFLDAVRSLLAEVFEQANAPGDSLFQSMTNGLNSWADALNRNPDIMRGWMDSLEAFGDFVGSTRDLLMELLSAGQDVGDSLFGSMSDQIDRWVATIRQNPEILRGWYDSAASFARVLGDVVIGFGKVFDALDNTFSRSLLVSTFEIIAGTINGIAGALDGLASLFGESGTAVENFAGKVAAAALVFPLFTKALGVGAITTFVGSLRDAEKRMGTLGGVARAAGGAGGLLAFSAGASESNRTAGLLMQTLGGAAIGASFGGPWGALIGGAAGLALGVFSGKVDEAGDSTEKAAPKVTDFASTLDAVTQAATSATRALALQRLEEEGAVGAARQLGIETRDLVLASLGNEDAQRRVNALMQLAGEKYSNAARSAGGLTDKQKEQYRALLDLRRELPYLNKEFDEQVKAARKAYLATQDLSGLLRTGFPKKIATAIDLQGVEPTIKGVAKVTRQYDLTPKQVRTLMEVMNVDFSMKEINRIIAKLDEAGKRKPKPKIEIDPSVYDKGMKDVNESLDAVGKVVKTPKVTVDTGSSVADTNAVKTSIEALRDRTITITTQYKVVRSSTDALPDRAPPTASGGVFYGAQTRLIGEAGPEAVVPLARNLSMVDPSVRWLSAFAQGKLDGMASGGIGGVPAKQVSADNWTIVTPTADPEAVAAEVLNRLVGAGY